MKTLIFIIITLLATSVFADEEQYVVPDAGVVQDNDENYQAVIPDSGVFQFDPAPAGGISIPVIIHHITRH